MGELGDFDLDPSPVPGPPAGPPAWPIVAAAGLVLVLVALGILGWVSRRSRGAEHPTAATSPAEHPATRSAAPPLGAPADVIELPPLGDSDPLVRQLVARLSTHPAVAAWLTTDGLIRDATAVVENVAAGQTPARHLTRIRPQAGFAVRGEGGQTVVDPRSYDRYTWIADAVASLDTEGSARLYSTLKPRVEEAYAELGSPETRFDATLERAIIVLLETPTVEGDAPTVTRGALYAYADPRLESLSPAQKQLLRTGPRNTRVIQAKLREIARALGVPADHLPQPATIQAR